MFNSTVLFAANHPRWVIRISLIIAALLCFAFPYVQVDVDPEAMLPADEPVRVYHNEVKAKMGLYDMVVVGITRDELDEGVFNPDSLQRVQAISDFVSTLDGVIAHEKLTPDNVDAIEPGGPGSIRFQWVMKDLPVTQEDAFQVRDRLINNPFLWQTMVSTDKKALAIYVPISAKEHSWRIAGELKAKVAELNGPEQYHITGLPVAEDTFGVEMFIQMAISAPLAMALIGLLIWWFFRNVRLTLAALAVAMLSVIITMGVFIATGQTLHIMSSMIPIFIMPIAVLDAVHILSQFYDNYEGKRRKAILHTMRELWKPMLFTSITTSVGFASLILAPIPPIQAFGLFTGLGVLVAWLLSMTFLPALICLTPKEKLASFGLKNRREVQNDALGTILKKTFCRGWGNSTLVILGAALLCGVSAYGVSLLQINDNPTKWFEEKHEIRVADKLINERFGGSYLVYLTLQQPHSSKDVKELLSELTPRLSKHGDEGGQLILQLQQQAEQSRSPVTILSESRSWIHQQIRLGDLMDEDEDEMFSMDDEESTDNTATWMELDNLIEQALRPYQIMKQPAVLRWMDRMTNEATTGHGHSVAQLVKKVNKELHGGDAAHFVIPDTPSQVMESYVSFQNSHDLHRLWHMVTQDYSSATALIQLPTGDNMDVDAAVKKMEAWMLANPAPVELQHSWSGLSYINIVWQQKMVAGMLYALGGSAVMVFLMMLFLYRNPLWAALSIVPLSLSILAVYGMTGLLGKDYDMPVAVLSALALGLSVDFAIHFITSTREFARTHAPYGAIRRTFREPGRGIFRNAVVITLGFSPLLFAPLVPYQTVGYLMIAIMLVSALATFLILPAILRIRFLHPLLFPTKEKRRSNYVDLLKTRSSFNEPA